MLWTKSMEGGIPAIDGQHKELFRQVDFLLNSDSPDRVVATIQFLEKYVVDHVGDEEKMHRESGYPLADEHRKMHSDFTKAFLRLKDEYSRSGYNLVTLLKLNRAVVEWPKRHVMGADMEFADFYRSAVIS